MSIVAGLAKGVATPTELVRGARAHAGFALAAIVLVLLVAGCGDDDAPESGREAGEDVTVKIAVNPWTGSAVNANVAKILLEQELGYTVELVEIDENTQFPALASGSLDASLEVWPSGHAADIQRYIEGRRGGPLRDGGIVDGGELGLIGNIGWWIPTYLVEEQPDLARYQGLQGNEDLVGGEFLAGGPDLRLLRRGDNRQPRSRSERRPHGLGAGPDRTARQRHRQRGAGADLLLQPHWAHRKFDLTEVQLPAFDEECEEAARERTARATTATTPTTFSSRRSGWGSRTRRRRRSRSCRDFEYTTDDQQEIAFQVDSEGVPMPQAAQQWIDDNPDVWRAWLP